VVFVNATDLIYCLKGKSFLTYNCMKKLLLVLLVFSTATYAQTTLATLVVNGPSHDLQVPLKINLDEITNLPDSAIGLVEVIGNKKTHVPFQIENGKNREIHWILLPRNGKRTFEILKTNKPQTPVNNIALTKNDGALIIRSSNRSLLQYNYKIVYPPAGINEVYKRSAFIHPLWSPHGQILTRIQPPDHYHHYGIWNPWTHLLYKGDTLDFWNLNSKDGTVRFANFISEKDGPVFGEYTALHEHVAFRKTGEEVILNETQSVRIYQPDNTDYYIADITMQYNCASNEPVLLLEYRYGGLGWRTTEQWDKNNSTVLTSEGKTRKDGDGTKARWCLVQGAVDNDHAGVLMMSYPTNYNHPEPLRIWPENQYNRGDMFANFDPTKDRDWLLEPGKNYTLKYRFLVFNGPFDKEKSESAWQNFATPPGITVKVNTPKK
jgi:hypothetical protein